MAQTSIEWTATILPDGTVTPGHTINPIRARDTETGAVGHACVKISTGCAHCYSSRMQRRFAMPEFTARIGPTIETFLDESKLQEVLRRKKPTKYFWCDMTDMFGDWVPDSLIDKCFAAMACSGHHTHQVLTKRADRMRDYLQGLGKSFERLEAAARSIGRTLRFENLPLVPWPLPNVWLGVSCESQEFADLRVTTLLQCRAAVKFLSCEPLLGPIDLRNINTGGMLLDSLTVPTQVRWVILGGESGPGARPCNAQWIADLVRQCKAAGTSVFVKQLGSKPYRCAGGHDASAATYGREVDCGGNAGYGCERYEFADSKGGDMDEWPEAMRVRQFPDCSHP